MSRVLAPKFKGFLTFASLRAAAATAPGQPTISDLLHTYRFRAHSMFDPELYRSRQEVQDWITRCPIARLRDRLQSLDLLDAAGFTALESAADDEVADAVTFAEAGTWEPVSDLARDLVAAEPAP